MIPEFQSINQWKIYSFGMKLNGDGDDDGGGGLEKSITSFNFYTPLPFTVATIIIHQNTISPLFNPFFFLD